MINYIEDDLFNSPDELLAHGCNAMGVMGAGVAGQLVKKYPWAFDAYIKAHALAKRPEQLLGRVIISVPPPPAKLNFFILHCITQITYGRDKKRHVNYDAVDVCFEDIASVMERVRRPSISIPKIGAGLGGGEWSIIEAIINHHLKRFNVNCYLGK